MALCVPAFRIITDLPSYYHHQVFLFTWMAGFIIFYTWLIQKIEALVGGSQAAKYIKWLGKNVTVVYVVQWLIIGNIATSIYKTQETWALLIWFPVILAGTTLLSLLFVKLRSKRKIYEYR